MKNWLWFLGICVLFIVACQERENNGTRVDVIPSLDSVVQDTAQNLDAVQVLDSPQSRPIDAARPKSIAVSKPPLDTPKRYPIIHIGDKDFDPNRYLGPDATESQRKYARKMIAQDSLKRVRALNSEVDSVDEGSIKE